MEILFPDRRPFLRLEFLNGVARDTHYCGEDVYEAIFRVRNGRWVSAYKVTGPRKNYTIVSVMTRKGF